jgi:hypothetical protein
VITAGSIAILVGVWAVIAAAERGPQSQVNVRAAAEKPGAAKANRWFSAGPSSIADGWPGAPTRLRAHAALAMAPVQSQRYM